MNKVAQLHECDQRFETLVDAIKDLLYDRGEGLPVSGIVGVLEIAKLDILKEAMEDSKAGG